MQTSDRRNQQLKTAARGALVGIIVYLIISSLKLGAAYFFHSASLRADGLNNLTDIISSILIFIGLRIARKPADEDHYFGHSKFEPLASFATSLIMFTVGLEVIKSSAERFIAQDYPTPDLQALWVGLAASVILLVTQRYIHHLAQQTQSMGLKASAKDLFSDFLTTLATMVAIAASSLGLAWLDILTALVIGGIILHTAYTIFKDSTFELSDGFDQEELEAYRAIVLKHPQIRAVPQIRARLCGQYVHVDITVLIDGHLSVIQSHHITEEIEQILAYNYNVYDVDVHVEPHFQTNLNQ